MSQTVLQRRKYLLACLYFPGLPTACFEDSVFELWANDGVFDESVDQEIENLTRDKILDKINNQNMRQEFASETLDGYLYSRHVGYFKTFLFFQ